MLKSAIRRWRERRRERRTRALEKKVTRTRTCGTTSRQHRHHIPTAFPREQKLTRSPFHWRAISPGCQQSAPVTHGQPDQQVGRRCPTMPGDA